MDTQETHEMIFEEVAGADADADELYCPVCGRRILVQWSPEFKKIVLEAGDEYAVHTASKGCPGVDNRRLADWEAGLEAMDFGRLWK